MLPSPRADPRNRIEFGLSFFTQIPAVMTKVNLVTPNVNKNGKFKAQKVALKKMQKMRNISCKKVKGIDLKHKRGDERQYNA